nr:hypothetical protein [uncultured bacterium]AMP54476.1 hypothetical protein [uncultured bacterium]
MNDDFFPTRQINNIPLVSRGRLVDLINQRNWQRGVLRRQVDCTVNFLGELFPGNFRDTWKSFDMVHRPLPVWRDVMREALSDREGYPLLHRSVYGNFLLQNHAARSVDMVDAKIRAYSAPVPATPDFSWISTSSSSWQGVAGTYIRGIHETPSPYEK